MSTAFFVPGLPEHTVVEVIDGEHAGAREFALTHHRTHLYGGLPYAVHLAEVDALLALLPYDRSVRQAGWLHDVDEGVPEGERHDFGRIVATFGEDTAGLVRQAQKVSTAADGNRAARHRVDLEHYARGTPRGQSIKLADTIANLRRAHLLAKGFARVYVPEKIDVIGALTQAHPTLRALAVPLVGWAGQVLRES